MSSSRSAIIALHQLGARNCEIARKLGIARSLVSRAIKRFKELGNEGDRPGRGRKRTVNTSNNRKIIKKRVQRNSMVSMRKIARETGINRESVRLIAKKELGLKPYKLQKCQLLTDENKKVSLERCRSLQRRAAGTGWEKIVLRMRSCLPLNKLTIIKTTEIGLQKPLDLRPLLNIVKIQPTEQKQPKSGAKPISPLSLLPKPPYSPDMNLLDYSVWLILEARACAKRHKTLEPLKQALRREWDRITVDELRPIAQNFLKRLSLCIRAKGDHFETG